MSKEGGSRFANAVGDCENAKRGAIGFWLSIVAEGGSRFANIGCHCGSADARSNRFLTDIQKNSGWKQLVLAFILFSCYPKR